MKKEENHWYQVGIFFKDGRPVTKRALLWRNGNWWISYQKNKGEVSHGMSYKLEDGLVMQIEKDLGEYT